MLALAAAFASIVALPAAGVAEESPTSPPAATAATAVAGEYLVGPEADLTRLPADATFRHIGGGWRLVRTAEQGAPTEVAGRLGRDTRARVVPNVLLRPAGLVDEPRFDEQWALENTGQTGGVPDADIDAADAFGLTTGDETVVVAILDSGIDLDHPELAETLWANPGEIAGNDIDDDGNGLVDDVNGWDFVANDADVSDATGHGTRVAGVVAAAANGEGIVGVAPGVRVMPVRVCGAGCPLSDIVEGLTYAADMGATIVNMSFTGVGSFFAPIGDVLAGDASGVLAVAAAGNDGGDNDLEPQYPASFDLPNVISVAATDASDELASFSNIGATSVDLGAPGVAILSTADGGDLELGDGTSYAAPHVAGVAALVASLRPGLTPEELAGYVLAGVDPLDDLEGLTVTGGRLNGYGALAVATAPEAVVTITPAAPTVPATVTFSGAASTDPAGSIVSYRWVFSDGTTATAKTVTRTFSVAATITASLTVTDDDGLTGTSSRTVVLRDGSAIVTATPTIGTVPATVSVSAMLPSGVATAATWDFGDGTTATGNSASHVYTTPGVYQVTVEVVGSSGGIGTGETVVYVGAAFTDTVGSLFATDIAWLSATGTTRGCNPPLNTRFCPTDSVTRGQAAALLTRALGLATGSDAFVDDDDSIFESDINALAAAGIAQGCNPPVNDRFCPTRTLTRAELASLLVRAFDLPPGPDVFGDDEGAVHEPDINALAAAGITIGCNPPVNDRFCPDTPVTRGQVAAFLHRADQ